MSDECRGMNMLRTFLDRRSNLPEVRYCWVDTWCIDQEDADDKARQIPRMADIYKNAQYVAVVVKHAFSFDQNQWDAVMSKLQPAFEHARSTDAWDIPDALACYSTPECSSNVIAGFQMLEELVSMAWFQRVWTAQEYILSRDILWIGLDGWSFHPCEEDIESTIYIMALQMAEQPTEAPAGERALPGLIANLHGLLAIRSHRSHPTNALHLAIRRKCKYPEDAKSMA